MIPRDNHVSDKHRVVGERNSYSLGSPSCFPLGELFANKEFRTVWLTREEIESNLLHVESFKTSQIEKELAR
ncbi:MAG: hypothetical protein PVI66_02480 [Candidatus Aminicenantes bacterium]|jgi:hypothetical protein